MTSKLKANQAWKYTVGIGIGIIILFVMYHCHNQKSGLKDQAIENARHDSIHKQLQADIEKEKVKKDSLAQAEQGKAIGNILFGINEAEFNKQEKIFMKKCAVLWEGTSEVRVHQIGDFEFYYISPSFYQKKLYEIIIRGHSIDYDEYDRRMKNDYRALMEVFKNKFGSPISDKGIPDWTTMEKNFSYYVADWDIGTKSIELRVSVSAISYTMDIHIYQQAIRSLVDNEKAKKENSIKKRTTEGL